MHVIGTAGHVDHGKSSLVQALTGIHPDRLKEEREREMTIDLGFAWFELPDGDEVGIVDVPGHRDFIENMLAGIGGIDAALLVVAADEGVMPQTKEHLAILDLLQISGGVVALNKVDLVDDDWLELVQEDLEHALAGTVLQDSLIIPVSARTGRGIPELKNALMEVLEASPPRTDFGRPRLPVDRAFSIAGFGTVVTGTLSDGSLSIGDEVDVLPQGARGRVRGLQTHKRKEEVAIPGSRTAVNITGISLDEIKRGDVIVHPNTYSPTQRMDVRFQLLSDASSSLRHNTEVKLFLGAAETIARVRLLGSDELLPGDTGWLQIEPSMPVIAVRGDRFILRRPSPGETLGGGMILDPHPKFRHRRFSENTLAKLEALTQGTPGEILYQTSQTMGPAPVKDLVATSSMEVSISQNLLVGLVRDRKLVIIDSENNFGPEDINLEFIKQAYNKNDIALTDQLWEKISSKTIQEVRSFHKNFPLRQGISREELKSRIKTYTGLSPKILNILLSKIITENNLVEIGPSVRIADFKVHFTTQQEQKIDNLLARFATNPYSPPSVKESQSEIGEDVYQALIVDGILVEVAPDVVFRREDFQMMIAEIRKMIKQQGPITAAEVRDHFKTSRKYSLALLEYLDSIGVTIREGDYRYLKDKKMDDIIEL